MEMDDISKGRLSAWHRSGFMDEIPGSAALIRVLHAGNDRTLDGMWFIQSMIGCSIYFASSAWTQCQNFTVAVIYVPFWCRVAFKYSKVAAAFESCNRWIAQSRRNSRSLALTCHSYVIRLNCKCRCRLNSCIHDILLELDIAGIHLLHNQQCSRWQITKRFARLCQLTPTGKNSWWRHQMEHFPRHWLFVREIHRSPQRAVTRNFDVFFDRRLNERLSKQWWDAIAPIMTSL